MFNFVLDLEGVIMDMDYNNKQREIMQSALALFADKGYDTTSIRDIAKAAGVNIAMISYYFGSKEKLLEAIFQISIKNIRDKLEKIVRDKEANPVDKIEQIIDTYIDAIGENRNFHLLLLREQVVVKNSSVYSSIREMKEKNSMLIRSAVKAGEKAGYFRKNTDVAMLAQTMFGTINQAFSNRQYLCELYKIDNNDKSFEKVIIQKLRLHLKTMFKYFLINEQNETK